MQSQKKKSTIIVNVHWFYVSIVVVKMVTMFLSTMVLVLHMILKLVTSCCLPLIQPYSVSYYDLSMTYHANEVMKSFSNHFYHIATSLTGESGNTQKESKSFEEEFPDL